MTDLRQSFALRVRQIEVAAPTAMVTVANLDHSELAVRLAREQALLGAAQPHVACLSTLLQEAPHVLYVADAEACVLQVEGDTDLASRVGISAGHTCWRLSSEALAAMAKGETIVVHAPGDASRNAWIAAPVRGPRGDLIAVIGLCTAEEHRDARDLPLAAYVASNIERTLAEVARMDEQMRLARELEQHKSQLRELDQRLELILENAPVYIYVVDENNRFLDVNRTWRQIADDDYRSIVGRTLYDVFPEATAANFEKNNREVLMAGARREFEEGHEGSTFLSVKVPVRDVRGRPYAICGMSVDITARKAAERALLESEARFRRMADGLPLIVWVHDEHGAQQFVNQTFCDFFGVTREEMQDGRWRMLMHPQDEAQYIAAFEQSVRAHAPFNAECRVRRADGQWRWIESWGRPHFNPDGSFRGIVGTSADITERKETAERLAASEAALRDTDRRKDEFLAALGHELRNPLAPLRNAAEILLRTRSDDPRVRTVAEMIERQTSQLVRLVDDLLDVSRIMLGKVNLEFHVLDLRAAVQDAIQATEQARKEKSQEFSTGLAGAPIWVRGDRVRLAQVFSNLLSNASRYTPSGGKISMRSWQAGDVMCVSVRDNGKGIAAEDLPSIFDLFHQAREDQGKGGLGIGLTLVKRFVEKHGGKVDAQSDGAGKGSEFVVRLPICDAPVIEPPSAEESPLARLKILVVDDNVDIVRSQEQVLAFAGHEVATAISGREAVSVAERFQPDVVLLDLGMPDVDGFGVARALRRSPRGPHMTIVAQTGYGHSGIDRDVAAAGFDGYIRKGAESGAVMAVIHALRTARSETPN
jgi:PAS domain S-box-containing protein